MNEIEQIEAHLVESLEDFVMSRGERREFRQLMEMIRGDHKSVAIVRKMAFRLATQRMEESNQVMDWLEAVIKVIYGKENEVKSRAYFSPGEDCLNEINSFVSGARESLDLCVFTITDNRIVRRIEEAHKRGVKIRLISDNDKSEDLGADVERLDAFGIPTVLDVTDAHMHHKFAIADGRRLLTGSYNWTRAACTENDENIVITNDPALTRQFVDEFQRLWEYLEPKQ